jgi:hypothetical protein
VGGEESPPPARSEEDDRGRRESVPRVREGRDPQGTGRSKGERAHSIPLCLGRREGGAGLGKTERNRSVDCLQPRGKSTQRTNSGPDQAAPQR